MLRNYEMMKWKNHAGWLVLERSAGARDRNIGYRAPSVPAVTTINKAHVGRSAIYPQRRQPIMSALTVIVGAWQ